MITKARKSTKILPVTTTHWPLDGSVSPLQQQRKSRISKTKLDGSGCVKKQHIWVVTCCCVFKAGTCFPGMNLNLLDLFRLAVVAFLCRPTTCSLTRTWYLQQRLIPFINVFLNPPFSSLAESAAASLGVLHLLLNPFQHFLHLPQLHIGKKWKDNLDKSDKSRWGRQ